MVIVVAMICVLREEVQEAAPGKAEAEAPPGVEPAPEAVETVEDDVAAPVAASAVEVVAADVVEEPVAAVKFRARRE